MLISMVSKWDRIFGSYPNQKKTTEPCLPGASPHGSATSKLSYRFFPKNIRISLTNSLKTLQSKQNNLKSQITAAFSPRNTSVIWMRPFWFCRSVTSTYWHFCPRDDNSLTAGRALVCCWATHSSEATKAYVLRLPRLSCDYHRGDCW